MPPPLRGQVWWVEIDDGERKPWLIVSNNQRNGKLNDVLAVRVTTSPKPSIPSIVVLGPEDLPAVGRVLCDDIVPVYKDELKELFTILKPKTMLRVDDALRSALRL